MEKIKRVISKRLSQRKKGTKGRDPSKFRIVFCVDSTLEMRPYHVVEVLYKSGPYMKDYHVVYEGDTQESAETWMKEWIEE